MNVKITYYLDVISSWCYWAEPAWAELKQRYAKAPVEFGWQIALLDVSGMSKSRAQADWFYRRSGTVVQSPFMLHSGWLDPYQPEFLAPNCVAEAAKDFGVKDDVVRLVLNPQLLSNIPAAAIAKSDSVSLLLRQNAFHALDDLLQGTDAAKPIKP